ncbi:MAG: 30S ribosomal protein S7 [Acidimicrobiia bacterium]|nr:30S ribosomal protein S7 [Acidimicrobiia bacterium]MBT8250589.1 30S ribosomal protein S7 [Acidimicrobiia bacterium]NNC42478.1 30S ribosomal protein S7 [Acidimicrobiia bacterium]NND14296.1 30S ribosomal protein S7 [Acidimicrobiia bacterium]NNL28753.1 30S ribosomal protein S7 [Acidimicrobiia bacterium]
MRRSAAEVRRVDPDPVYRSVLVTQVINKVLQKGKKAGAKRIVYEALELVEKRANDDPTVVLKRAIDNLRPSVEVRSRRVGGSSYQVPVEVRPRRQTTLAVRWLVDYARRRRERSMVERLANEILDASNNTGSAVKRREDIHKMAESNKAFAHYRW